MGCVHVCPFESASAILASFIYRGSFNCCDRIHKSSVLIFFLIFLLTWRARYFHLEVLFLYQCFDSRQH